jgi:TolA-binding protein
LFGVHLKHLLDLIILISRILCIFSKESAQQFLRARENGAEKVSYEDLSEIFVRSKDTISECVNQTETAWRELQEDIEKQKQIDAEAKKQLIEEQKQKLRQEEQNKPKESPDKRTNTFSPTEERIDSAGE